MHIFIFAISKTAKIFILRDIIFERLTVTSKRLKSSDIMAKFIRHYLLQKWVVTKSNYTSCEIGFISLII